ncbi:C40 family peptidase [Gordonia sp. X0973]|uniref:C40 family peptidase n=1 Tax=Gordonia sp. X0973 TaxID=2742602 RepID=UPI000F53A380|nr:C40 family peptidase [Gordonia sp. X0973]QKT06727.1 C40 family peptidase [Gordonia sp. X0973]
MTGVDALIAPLRALLTTLGTGDLPPNSPVSALERTATASRRAADDAERTARSLPGGWSGNGGTAAAAAARSAGRRHRRSAATGTSATAIVETASARVKHAATELSRLLDSFARVANSLGPTVYSIEGLMALLPVALDHVGRGAAIVAKTQHELSGDAARLLATAKHLTPQPVPRHSRPPAMLVDHGRDGKQPTDHSLAVTLPNGKTVYAPNARAATAVRAALSQRGVPYRWGGTTPNGFDCSGLTQWAYRRAGLEIPRLAQDQDDAGVRVDQAHLQPGDLAVWDGHVAMVIGDGLMVEAGDPVQVNPVRTGNLGMGFQGFYRPR